MGRTSWLPRSDARIMRSAHTLKLTIVMRSGHGWDIRPKAMVCGRRPSWRGGEDISSHARAVLETAHGKKC